MKKKTYTGTQNILQQFGAAIVYSVGAAVGAELPAVMFIALILAAIISIDGNIKRLRAFGFNGELINFLFPNLTDGTYPDRDNTEKKD